MPTTYKATIDHDPMDWKGLNDVQEKAVNAMVGFKEIFQKRYKIALDEDDMVPLIHNLEQILIRFSLDCNARSLRTPRKLIATSTYIAKHPAKFLTGMDKFDPEAVDMVSGSCCRASSENEKLLLDFERGIGLGPPLEEIAKAARIALANLRKSAEPRSNGGRPKLELQGCLAIALGDFFVKAGGRLSRTVHDGETGPFYQFLELVLPIVRPHARRAGFALTATTMVAKARAGLRSGRNIPAHS